MVSGMNNTGADLKKFDSDLDQFARELAKLTGRVSTANLKNQGLDGEILHLRLVRGKKVLGNNEEKTPVSLAPETLPPQKEKWISIAAKSGSGKTTWLHRLAQKSMEESSDRDQKVEVFWYFHAGELDRWGKQGDDRQYYELKKVPPLSDFLLAKIIRILISYDIDHENFPILFKNILIAEQGRGLIKSFLDAIGLSFITKLAEIIWQICSGQLTLPENPAIRTLRNLLNQLINEGRITLLFDGLDQASSCTIIWLNDARSKWSQSVRVVVAGRYASVRNFRNQSGIAIDSWILSEVGLGEAANWLRREASGDDEATRREKVVACLFRDCRIKSLLSTPLYVNFLGKLETDKLEGVKNRRSLLDAYINHLLWQHVRNTRNQPICSTVYPPEGDSVIWDKLRKGSLALAKRGEFQHFCPFRGQKNDPVYEMAETFDSQKLRIFDLFSSEGEGYDNHEWYFYHQSIQAYCAALQIALLEKQEKVLEWLPDDSVLWEQRDGWEEILTLLPTILWKMENDHNSDRAAAILLRIVRHFVARGELLFAWVIVHETEWELSETDFWHSSNGKSLRGWGKLLLQLLTYRLDLDEHIMLDKERWHTMPLPYAAVFIINMNDDERKDLAQCLRSISKKGFDLPEGFGILELAAKLGATNKHPASVSLGFMLGDPLFPEHVKEGTKILLNGAKPAMTFDPPEDTPAQPLCTNVYAWHKALQWLGETLEHGTPSQTCVTQYERLMAINEGPKFSGSTEDFNQLMAVELDPKHDVDHQCNHILIWFGARYVEALLSDSLPPLDVGYSFFGMEWNMAITTAVKMRANEMKDRVLEWVQCDLDLGVTRFYDFAQVFRGVLSGVESDDRTQLIVACQKYFRRCLKMGMQNFDTAFIYAVYQEWLRQAEEDEDLEQIRATILRHYAYEARLTGLYYGKSPEQIKKIYLRRIMNPEYSVKRWYYYLLMPLFATEELSHEEKDILNTYANTSYQKEALKWEQMACNNARKALSNFHREFSVVS